MSLPLRRKKICPVCTSVSLTTLVYCTNSMSAWADLKAAPALSISASTDFKSDAGAAAPGDGVGDWLAATPTSNRTSITTGRLRFIKFGGLALYFRTLYFRILYFRTQAR